MTLARKGFSDEELIVVAALLPTASSISCTASLLSLPSVCEPINFDDDDECGGEDDDTHTEVDEDEEDVSISRSVRQSPEYQMVKLNH